MSYNIPRISDESTPWLFLLTEFGFKNKPFILTSWSTENWTSRKLWVEKILGGPNLKHFEENYGNSMVPILKNGITYENIKLTDYLSSEKNSEVYLKDWHFQKEYGNSMYTPLHPFFSRDFVNLESWTEHQIENPFGDDYRFVYFGVAGTWTKFHSDVISSHSWSANICGRKLWYMMRPGMEKHFTSSSSESGFVEDLREFENLFEIAGVFSFIQEPGEIVFVPSNWYHQVHNLTDTISINHNWINATNLNFVKNLLDHRVLDVRNELEDCREFFTEAEFEEKVELVLFADARLNFEKFQKMCILVKESRKTPKFWTCDKHGKHLNLCISDTSCHEKIQRICNCSENFCEKCLNFIKSLEFSIASTFLW